MLVMLFIAAVGKADPDVLITGEAQVDLVTKGDGSRFL